MIRSDVARVKCFECLMIIIRNQGGTAEDIRPFLLKKGTFFYLTGNYALKKSVPEMDNTNR